MKFPFQCIFIFIYILIFRGAQLPLSFPPLPKPMSSILNYIDFHKIKKILMNLKLMIRVIWKKRFKHFRLFCHFNNFISESIISLDKSKIISLLLTEKNEPPTKPKLPEWLLIKIRACFDSMDRDFLIKLVTGERGRGRRDERAIGPVLLTINGAAGSANWKLKIIGCHWTMWSSHSLIFSLSACYLNCHIEKSDPPLDFSLTETNTISKFQMAWTLCIKTRLCLGKRDTF